jgi:dephospho-CoA kinase
VRPARAQGSPLPEVRRIGLTGGIATGKSYVRSKFEELGVPTIDADTLARQAVAPGSGGLAAVVARFGPAALDASGALNRRALAQIVFSDAAARRDLEAIIHPYVRAQADAWFTGLDAVRHPLAIADIPLLYETGTDNLYDAVIVTACEPEEQVRRIVARDSVTEAEARQRLAAQMPIEQKVRRADFVIRTDGSHAETDRQVNEVLGRLTASPSPR